MSWFVIQIDANHINLMTPLLFCGGCKFCFMSLVITPLAIYSREVQIPEMSQFPPVANWNKTQNKHKG